MTFTIPAIAQMGSFILSNGMAILSAAGGIAGAVGTYNQGVAAQSAAYSQAAQLDAQARNERAVSHYEMAKQQREAKSRASETQLALASGGFAADDPSSVALVSENAGRETLEQLMTKALAEQRARGMEQQGAQLRKEGKQARRAATLSAFSSLVGSGASWAQRYGGSLGGGGSFKGYNAPTMARVGNSTFNPLVSTG